MKNVGLIVGVIVAVVAVGGGFYALNSGLLNANYQANQAPQYVQEEAAPQEESATEAAATKAAPEEPVVEEDASEPSAEAGTPVEERDFTVEEAEAKPTLCEQDSDCKVQLITCNQCDCGRGVNNWIEDYACTEADKANSCGIVCPPSKAVCDGGVCKKVDL